MERSTNDDPEDGEGIGGRPTPARRRGPRRDLSEQAARFVSRAAATDRRGRFEQRRQEVAEMRRTRRRRQLLVSAVAVTTTVGVSVAVGAVVAGTIGALVGLAVAVTAGAVAVLVRWLARRRGATAWDWTTHSHRLMGDPADRVRSDDRRRGDPDARSPWTS